MEIDIESKEFLKDINEFHTAYRKKKGFVQNKIGKLVVRDAMSLTPPAPQLRLWLVVVSFGVQVVEGVGLVAFNFEYFTFLAAAFTEEVGDFGLLT